MSTIVATARRPFPSTSRPGPARPGTRAERPARGTRTAGREPPTIKGLLSYRLHQVANLFSRGAAMRYRREFGVSLWEWRTLALLGAHAPLSLKELASAAGLDKSQMSRVVAGLDARHLVRRGAHATDGRGVQLSLTRSGVTVYHGLIRAARARNAAFLGCLTESEREVVDGALQKLGDLARAFIQRERALAVAPARRMRRRPTRAAHVLPRAARARGSAA